MEQLRSVVVGEDIVGAVTNVLVWFLFITNILSVSARLGTRYYVSKEFEWDDGLQLLAQVHHHPYVAFLSHDLEVSLSTCLHR